MRKEELLAKRRREALVAAERCTDVLKRRFGARRVILSGSLVNEGPWHESSDLDLAVEGVSAEALWKHERICERVAVMLDEGLPQGEGWHRALWGKGDPI